jgi:hypothetical protein
MKRSPTERPKPRVTDTIRRVVTTHDPAGKAVLLSDARGKAVLLALATKKEVES